MATIATSQMTCGAAPVQFEGRLTDGRWFYFRARGEHVALTASSVSVEDAVELQMDTRGFGSGVWIDAPHTVHRDTTDQGRFSASGLPYPWRVLAEMAAELPEVTQ